MNRPDNLTLANWREHPNSQWAFQNVREIIASAPIRRSEHFKRSFPHRPEDIGNLQVKSPAGECRFEDLLKHSHTDCLMVLKNSAIAYEWKADYFNPANPHILFSISKSTTAMLAGILENHGLFNSAADVIDYLPGIKGSVYENCSLRHVLDMTVSLNFEENYSDTESEYRQYRAATAWNPADQTADGPGLEAFLYSLKQLDQAHGKQYLYRSPNSDLLGLVLERSAGKPLADLFSEYLWQPIGAEDEGYVTVDKYGIGRAAGGICLTIRDFVKLGQLFVDRGQVNGKQILSEHWIDDTMNNGDRDVWLKGYYAHRIPNGKYRNKWYQFGDEDNCIHGRGIHGQQLFINPKTQTVIGRFSSSPDPLNDEINDACFTAFHEIAKISV